MDLKQKIATKFAQRVAECNCNEQDLSNSCFVGMLCLLGLMGTPAALRRARRSRLEKIEPSSIARADLDGHSVILEAASHRDRRQG